MGVKRGLSHRLQVIENRVLRRIFGRKREDVTEVKDLIVRSFKTGTLHQI
jgi:hypothetical protein